MNAFARTISIFLDRHLDVETLLTHYEFGYLSDLLEASFKQNGNSISKQEKAVVILSELFSRLVPGFSFANFVAEIGKKSEQKSFLTTLLFMIYAQNFEFARLQKPALFRLYLFQIYAQNGSRKGIRTIWAKLNFDQKIRCLGYLFAFYDEGSHRILEQVKGIALKRRLAQGLVARDSLWNWCEATAHISKENFQQFVSGCKREVAKSIKELYKQLGTTQEAVRRFVNVFGLYGLQLPLDSECARQHVEALFSHPERYKNGFDQIVYALPTLNKPLKELFWLQSVLEGMKELGEIIDVSHHPIFVFDQSRKALFLKNRRYIERLERRYKQKIIHLDEEAIISLAEKVSCHDLVVTGPKRRFGYGGARNAIFLLAPLLARLYKGQKEFLSFLEKRDAPYLQKEFDKSFQENTPFIHMGDDDVYIPPSLLFSDALWAAMHKDRYACRWGYFEGRFATDVNIMLHNVLQSPHKILSQVIWLNEPAPHGMSGLLSKPKLCLNLPFGQEEQHLLCMEHHYVDLRRPVIHLAGNRFPKVSQVPDSRFSGLAKLLKSTSQDIYERLLVTELLDPNNRYEMCALPWNSSGINCSSFAEMIQLLCSDKTKKEMQEQYWKNFERNVRAFHQPIASQEVISSQALQEIIDADLDALKMPKELLAYFRKMQKEAINFKAYCEAFSRQKPHEDHRLSFSLYLMHRAIGLAGFQEALKKLPLKLLLG